VTPKAIDAGSLASNIGEQAITVTIPLKLHDPDGANQLLQSMYTPGDPNFQKFLTPDEFRARFAATPAEVAKVTASLTKLGLKVDPGTSTTLLVTGTPTQLERAFQVALHQFKVGSQGRSPSYSYRGPTGAPTLPDDAAALVHGVVGLETRPHFRPHAHHLPDSFGAALVKPQTSSANANTSGNLTVTDFARIYDVKPLYDKGIKGTGRTIGIVTLASFTPSDAYAYWTALGLPVSPGRISVVDIDGGPGAPSDASGSDETTLDVEQSGGLAPVAKLIVYQAPNTNQGFLDAFARAVDSNVADSISVSWGAWEWYSNLANGPVTDPYTHHTVSFQRALHEILLQAALQGQSMFAASGDAGAYDANDGTDGNGVAFLPPDYTLALSVDNPADDPFITAAGGTTLPGKQTYSVGSGKPPVVVDIKTERVWSWDYLVPLCAKLGYDPISCGIFPVGSGGGVSVFFDRPFYQDGLAGVMKSEPKQALVYEDSNPPQTLFKLPANFAGRNVPDISANADPDTGYALYYTSDQNGFSIETFYGGTSFVAPQMAGVTALLGESLHQRVGLMNVPLYWIARTGGYGGKAPPLRAIKDGNNDFYEGSDGYNPGAGLGVLDVAKLASALKSLFGH
jgi:subtilase family serine protease